MEVSAGSLEESVRDAVGSLYDPCSLTAAMPVTIVDLGIVRSVHVDDEGNVEIKIGTTSPGCLLCPSVIWRGLQETVGAIPGVRSVKLSVDPTFFWTPEQMNQETRRKLDERRDEVAERLDLRPQSWREQVARQA